MAFPTLTVEIAFASNPDDTLPKYQDVSSYVRDVTIRRGRNYELDTIQAGTCTVTLNNGDRRFDPTYSMSPYAPNVIPMRRLRVSATWSGTTYYLFSGYVERWPIEWDLPSWGTVSITAVDGMAALSTALITGTFPQEVSGSRISRVLSAAAWPDSTPQAGGYWVLGTSQLGISDVLSYGTPGSVIDAGRTSVAAVTLATSDGVTALDHIQEVAEAEHGLFFIDGQGRAVFQDRFDRYNTSSAVTFTDGTIDATHLPYRDLRPDMDVMHIANEVTVTGVTGNPQTAEDPQSRSRFFRRTLSLSPPVLTDADALSRAYFELLLRKEPKQRYDSITVQPQSNDNLWPHALGREISDRVTVVRTPGMTPAGMSETTTKSVFIEEITHFIAPQRWETSFQLSPADDIYNQFWTLGTSALGSTTVLAY